MESTVTFEFRSDKSLSSVKDTIQSWIGIRYDIKIERPIPTEPFETYRVTLQFPDREQDVLSLFKVIKKFENEEPPTHFYETKKDGSGYSIQFRTTSEDEYNRVKDILEDITKIPKDPMKPTSELMYCPTCAENFMSDSYDVELTDFNIIKRCFCPNCGARMKGADDE